METSLGNLAIFTPDAPATVINGMFDVIGANIAPILGLLGLTLGISFVVSKFGAAKKGRI